MEYHFIDWEETLAYVVAVRHVSTCLYALFGLQNPGWLLINFLRRVGLFSTLEMPMIRGDRLVWVCSMGRREDYLNEQESCLP